MNINFSEKEMEVIKLISPEKSVEQTINTVLRDWFNSNATRMHRNTITTEEVLDDIISKGGKIKDK